MTGFQFGSSGTSRQRSSTPMLLACGSFIEFEGKVFHQNWSDFEKAQSSTFRELLAVSLSLKAFVESLKAQTVIIDKGQTGKIKATQVEHTLIASHRPSQNDRKEWKILKSVSRSHVVYEFPCAGCSACYVGETNRHS